MNILITGGNGFLGSELAIIAKKAYKGAIVLTPSKEELDLLDYAAVDKYFAENNIQKVFHCAGKVSGMFGHNQSDDMYVNSVVGLNTVRAAYKYFVNSFVNIGSTCIYPKDCKAPVDESQLLQGAFEPSCSGMALAKSLVVKYLDSTFIDDIKFMTVMPPNIYGPGEPVKDHGNHCILDIMLKLHNAKVNDLPTVELPGTGQAIRSFMHVQDCAMAIVWCEQHNTEPIINIGSDIKCSIAELVSIIADVVGYTGEIKFIGTKEQDGHPDKTEDITKLLTSIKYYNPCACISLKDGIAQLYNYVLIVNNER